VIYSTLFVFTQPRYVGRVRPHALPMHRDRWREVKSGIRFFIDAEGLKTDSLVEGSNSIYESQGA
jgi:hypothetical protein